MDAIEFKNYCLGLIFYKYLSENLWKKADEILKADGKNFRDLRKTDKELLKEVREECIDELGMQYILGSYWMLLLKEL